MLSHPPEVAEWMTFREIDSAIEGYNRKTKEQIELEEIRQKADWHRMAILFNAIAPLSGIEQIDLSTWDETERKEETPEWDPGEWEALKERAIKHGNSR